MTKWENKTDYDLPGLQVLIDKTLAKIQTMTLVQAYPVDLVRFTTFDLDKAKIALNLSALPVNRTMVVYKLITAGRSRTAGPVQPPIPREVTLGLIPPPQLFSTAIEKVVRLVDCEAPIDFTVEIVRVLVLGHPAYYGRIVKCVLHEIGEEEVQRIHGQPLPELWRDGSYLGKETLGMALNVWISKQDFAQTPLRFAWAGDMGDLHD